MGAERLLAPKRPTLSQCRPIVAIPGKDVQCQWGQLACVHCHTPHQTSIIITVMLCQQHTLAECSSVHSCRELSILVRDTRRQPGETRDPLTHAHRPLQKRDLNEARHECRGYTRGSKARRVFLSTLSLSLAMSRVQSARVYSRH